MSNTFSRRCCPIPRHYIDGQHLLRGWSLPFNMSRLDDGNKSGQEHSDTPRFWSMLSVTLSTAFSFSSRVKETNQIYLQIKHVKNEKSFKLLIGSVRIISIRIIIICIESCLGVYVFKQTFETLICPTILSLVGKTRRRVCAIFWAGCANFLLLFFDTNVNMELIFDYFGTTLESKSLLKRRILSFRSF